MVVHIPAEVRVRVPHVQQALILLVVHQFVLRVRLVHIARAVVGSAPCVRVELTPALDKAHAPGVRLAPIPVVVLPTASYARLERLPQWVQQFAIKYGDLQDVVIV